jgi:hypothetical protein
MSPCTMADFSDISEARNTSIIIFSAEDVSSTYLRNVGEKLPEYMASHARGQYLHSYCSDNLTLRNVRRF